MGGDGFGTPDTPPIPMKRARLGTVPDIRLHDLPTNERIEAVKIDIYAERLRFGEAVRTQRKMAGRSQQSLATQLTTMGVSMTQTMMAKMERGDRPTPVEEACAIAQSLGISVLALLMPEGADEDTARRDAADAESIRLRNFADAVLRAADHYRE